MAEAFFICETQSGR